MRHMESYQELRTIVHYLAYGKSREQRNKMIRKAFEYADKHGYDVAIRKYLRQVSR